MQGVSVWKIAEQFFTQYKSTIVISNRVIKEIVSKNGREGQLKEIMKDVEIISVTPEEYSLAQEIESMEKYTLSFYDCIHLAICKKRNFVLITRDRELIDKGNIYVLTIKPESIIY